MTWDSSQQKVSVVREACRLLNACEAAILCAMSHRQLTIDGHPIHPRDDRRWTEAQLSGRTVKVNQREGVMFCGVG